MARQGSLVVVEGASGLGKSHLLEAFCQQLRQQGHTVIQSLGRAFNGQRPLENLEPVLQALERQPAQLARITPKLASWFSALHHSHPLAQQLFPDNATSTDERAKPLLRLDEAWVHLLNALGEQGQAVTLVLDDAQWMDSQSAQVLRRWWREQPLEGSALLVVLGVRPGAHPSMAGLGPQRVSQWLTLEPLDLPACARLALGWMPTLEPPVLQELHRLCEGNPFLLKALVQNLQIYAQGLQPSAPHTHRLLRWLQAPKRSALLLQRHLEVLPQRGVALLEVGALLGRSFDIHIAAQVLDIPRRLAQRLLRQAQRHDLVQVEEEHQARFTHDKLREAALGRLSDEKRQQMHQCIARLYAQQAKPDPFTVAYHYTEAGSPRKALPYARRAATQAHQSGAHQQALDYLEIVAQALENASPKERLPVLAAQGENLLALGRYQEGEQCMTQALALCQSQEARLQLQIRLGQLIYRRSDPRRSADLLEETLTQLGGYVPSNRAFALLWMLWCLVAWNLGGPLRRLSSATRPAPPPQVEQRARLRHMLNYSYGFLKEYIAVTSSILWNITELESYQRSTALTLAQLDYTFLMMLLGRLERAAQVAQQARTFAEELRDREQLAMAHQHLALVHYTRCALPEALQHSQRALQMHERMGEHWDFNLTLYIHGLIQLGLGNLEEVLRVGLRLYQRGRQAQEHFMTSGALFMMHTASLGELPCDSDALDEMASRARELDTQQQAAYQLCRAMHHLYLGELEQVTAPILRAQGLSTRIRLEFTGGAIAAAPQLTRLAWEALPQGRRSAQRRAWHKALRTLERYASTYPRHRCAALRERAWWCTWHNQADKAHEKLTHALKLAEHQHMVLERLYVLQAWASIAERLGWPEAQARHQEATSLRLAISTPPEQLERIRGFLLPPGPR